MALLTAPAGGWLQDWFVYPDEWVGFEMSTPPSPALTQSSQNASVVALLTWTAAMVRCLSRRGRLGLVKGSVGKTAVDKSWYPNDGPVWVGAVRGYGPLRIRFRLQCTCTVDIAGHGTWPLPLGCLQRCHVCGRVHCTLSLSARVESLPRIILHVYCSRVVLKARGARAHVLERQLSNTE